MANKLLIVDDEPRIYQALRRALHRERDWSTVYAENGEAALELLESEVIDVVIVDENMPGMSGTKLLSAVRQRWPDIIRMMLTGDARIDVLMNAVNRGEIYRFFTKPANEAELIIAIRDALQMRQLKEESRRLLATVRQQAAEIRRLQGDAASESDADLLSAGPHEAVAVPAAPAERASLSLDDMARRNRRAATDVLSLDADTDRGDIDSLLGEIRSQLDRLV